MTDNNEGWISVKDRLPRQYETVLIYRKDYNNIFIAKAYNSKYKGKIDHWSYCEVDGTNRVEFSEKVVTHWQPLPSPPRTKE